MQIRRLFLLYFSPTGHARRVARMLAGGLRASGLPIDEIDVTDKWDREEPREFGPGDLVFTAFPVYFGRLPLPLQTLDCWSGNGALAVPVAAYGNRAYEDALREAADRLRALGFTVPAAAAFATEHNQSRLICPGRPNDEDRPGIEAFARRVLEKVASADEDALCVELPGEGEYRPYGRMPAVPQPDEICRHCGRCVEVCPMDIIDPTTMTVREPDQCIGCRACTAACPDNARHYPAPVEARIAELMASIHEKNPEHKPTVVFL